jgi:invasion protein IalB
MPAFCLQILLAVRFGPSQPTCPPHIENLRQERHSARAKKENQKAMVRQDLRVFAALIMLSTVAALVSSSSALSKARKKESKTAPKAEKAEKPAASPAPGRPSQLGLYGDWGVYFAEGEKSKTCYALATPKDRAPAGLNRDPAYVFISSRPGENVRQEVSVTMGFPLKEDGAHAEISGSNFALIAKGTNAWIKNMAEEPHFIEALKKGSKLIVKAASTKGNVTTDSYSLAGLSQALERLEKECP